jgi:hypothetical protein
VADLTAEAMDRLWETIQRYGQDVDALCARVGIVNVTALGAVAAGDLIAAHPDWREMSDAALNAHYGECVERGRERLGAALRRAGFTHWITGEAL